MKALLFACLVMFSGSAVAHGGNPHAGAIAGAIIGGYIGSQLAQPYVQVPPPVVYYPQPQYYQPHPQYHYNGGWVWQYNPHRGWGWWHHQHGWNFPRPHPSVRHYYHHYQ